MKEALSNDLHACARGCGILTGVRNKLKLVEAPGFMHPQGAANEADT
jgi:hypothetical protein